jgi:hypothetical protein
MLLVSVSAMATVFWNDAQFNSSTGFLKRPDNIIDSLLRRSPGLFGKGASRLASGFDSAAHQHTA